MTRNTFTAGYPAVMISLVTSDDFWVFYIPADGEGIVRVTRYRTGGVWLATRDYNIP